MNVHIEHASPCRVVVHATVPVDEVNAERERIVATFVKSARLDGFRKGKAPRPLVERRFADAIRDDLAEDLVRAAWNEVREGEALHPAGPLEVRRTAWQDDGSFELSAELDVYPEVELPELSSFAPPPFDVEPDEEEIEKTIAGLRERQAQWEPVEGEAAAREMLVEAEVDGSFPEGGGEPFHEERSLFQLGHDEVHPEIEAAVVGHGVGEEVGVERVLGEEAGERQGVRASYRVRIKSLRRKRVPDADDAFARSMGIEGGLAALQERVLAQLRLEKQAKRRDAWRTALETYLAGERPVPMPEGLVNEETREELVKFARALAGRGIDPEQADFDWKKMEADVRPRVEARLRGELLLDAVAEKLGIAVSDAEVDAEVERQARGMGLPFAEVRGNLAKRGGLERIRAILRRERATDQVLRPALEGAR